METEPRLRSKRQKLRVTFPDGEVICYTSSKKTYVETLKKIGADKVKDVYIEICHLPLFSQTIYPQYKGDMASIGDGWYVNLRGGTTNRYAQLKVISEKLNLGLQVDMSDDFKGETIHRGPKNLCVLEVTLPDGTTIGEKNSADTFMQCIWSLGIDKVRKLNLKHGGHDLITTAKLYPNQVQVDTDRWLIVPGAIKDKVKILTVIGAMLHVKLDITSFSI